MRRNSKKKLGRMKIEYRLQENIALDYSAISRGSPEEDGVKEP